MKKITNKQIAELAAQFGIEKEAAYAVILTESSGSGFADDGRMKIQFEPHVFAKELDKLKIENKLVLVGKDLRGLKIWDITVGGLTIRNGVERHDAEWQAYTLAFQTNAEAAMLATSFGMGQVMGFNYRICGYRSAQEMVEKFSINELEQVKGMFGFIKANYLIDEIQRKDWAGFARVYNGPGYAIQKYDAILADNYAKAKTIKW